jgi:hypothetical protein
LLTHEPAVRLETVRRRWRRSRGWPRRARREVPAGGTSFLGIGRGDLTGAPGIKSELASAVFGICSAQEAGAFLLRDRVGLLTGVLLSHWCRADQAADKTESAE